MIMMMAMMMITKMTQGIVSTQGLERVRGLARRRAERPMCSTWAGERRRSEKQKIIAMTMDVINQSIGLGLQEGAGLRRRICLIMASFDGSGNTRIKKHSSTSLNHFKLILLPRPDDLQEECCVTMKRLAHLVAQRGCDQVNVDCLFLEEEGVHQLVNLKIFELFFCHLSTYSCNEEHVDCFVISRNSQNCLRQGKAKTSFGNNSITQDFFHFRIVENYL